MHALRLCRRRDLLAGGCGVSSAWRSEGEGSGRVAGSRRSSRRRCGRPAYKPERLCLALHGVRCPAPVCRPAGDGLKVCPNQFSWNGGAACADRFERTSRGAARTEKTDVPAAAVLPARGSVGAAPVGSRAEPLTPVLPALRTPKRRPTGIRNPARSRGLGKPGSSAAGISRQHSRPLLAGGRSAQINFPGQGDAARAD